jgi:hypothetical protein
VRKEGSTILEVRRSAKTCLLGEEEEEEEEEAVTPSR